MSKGSPWRGDPLRSVRLSSVRRAALSRERTRCSGIEQPEFPRTFRGNAVQALAFEVEVHRRPVDSLRDAARAASESPRCPHRRPRRAIGRIDADIDALLCDELAVRWIRS